MAVEKFGDGGIIVTGVEDTTRVHWISVRSALKLEVKTGIPVRRGFSMARAANRISGGTSRSKKKAYEDLDNFLVSKGIPSMPLEAKKDA